MLFIILNLETLNIFSEMKKWRLTFRDNMHLITSVISSVATVDKLLQNTPEIENDIYQSTRLDLWRYRK